MTVDNLIYKEEIRPLIRSQLDLTLCKTVVDCERLSAVDLAEVFEAILKPAPWTLGCRALAGQVIREEARNFCERAGAVWLLPHLHFEAA